MRNLRSHQFLQENEAKPFEKRPNFRHGVTRILAGDGLIALFLVQVGGNPPFLASENIRRCAGCVKDIIVWKDPSHNRDGGIPQPKLFRPDRFFDSPYNILIYSML